MAACLRRGLVQVLFQSIVLATCRGISTCLASGVLGFVEQPCPHGASPADLSTFQVVLSLRIIGCHVGTPRGMKCCVSGVKVSPNSFTSQETGKPDKNYLPCIRCKCVQHHLRAILSCSPYHHLVISTEDEISFIAGSSWKQYPLLESILAFFFMPFLEFRCFPYA